MPTAAQPPYRKTPGAPSQSSSADAGAFRSVAARLGKVLSRSRYGSAPLVAICVYFFYRQNVLAAVHDSPWAQFIYLGMLLLYLGSGPTFHEILGAVFFGVFLTCGVGLPATFVYPGGALVTTGAYIGVIGVLALVWRAPRDVNARRMLFRCIAFLAMGLCIDRLLALNSRFAAWKLDLYLYALDLKLIGFAPSFRLAASRFQSYMRPAELLIYYALPFVTTLVYAAHITRGRPRATNFALMAIANLIVGYVAYLFYPAAGPAYAFPAVFPKLTPVLGGLHPQMIAAPANAMPSLHMSAALLIWWNAKHWRFARYFALAFLALTLLATIGLGEHYCTDLIVAAPYALFIQALGTRRPLRMTCLLAGLSMTVAWLVLLRYGFSLLAASSLLLRTGAVLTVCIPLWLSHRLLREPAGIALSVRSRGREGAVFSVTPISKKVLGAFSTR
jgi:hypothetical protein